MLAALNHPNIAQIYGVEHRALVIWMEAMTMEYSELRNAPTSGPHSTDAHGNQEQDYAACGIVVVPVPDFATWRVESLSRFNSCWDMLCKNH